MQQLRTGHLFAGVGGGILCDLILGHKPIFAVEWEKYCCKILRERVSDGWFDGMHVHECDIRMFDPSIYKGKVDCLAAGFPCTDLSVAGKQAGLGEGTRSGLYREVLRIAGVVRPRYLFLENVSAILSNGLGCVLGDLAAMGYDCRWLCIRASDVGAPHGRDRWFAIAELCGDGRRKQQQEGIKSSAEELAYTKRDGLQGVWENRNTEGQAGLCGRARSDKEQNICHTTGEGLSDWSGKPLERSGAQPEFERPDWWEAECLVGRVVDGDTNRVHRLKGLGNAQVPLQAAAAWRILTHNAEITGSPKANHG